MRLAKRALSVSLALAALSLAREASAEPFAYTDRTGRVHRVDPTPLTVSRSATPEPAPLAEAAPVALPAALPAAPLAAPVVAAALAPTTVPVFALAPAPDERLPVVPSSAPLETPSRSPFFPLIQEAAALYSLPVELVLAVIKVESNFNAQAVSKKGALGLMQLMPTTATDLGVTDAFDPRQNIFAGTRYLRWLVNEFDGHLTLAVAAYNAGVGTVRRAGGIPQNSETVAYVPAVLAAYRGYQAAVRPRKDDASW